MQGCPGLDGYDIVFADLDGVIWIGGEPIEDNLAVLRRLASEGRLVVLTNNSTRSRRVYASMLRSIGLNIPPERIVTSAYSAAVLLKKERGPSTAMVVGEEGLVEELVLEGHTVASSGDDVDVDAVVVGLDRNLTYGKLARAASAIHDGSLFVATNLDHALPTPKGLIPGAGSIVALLEKATGVRPAVVAGKPSRGLVEVLQTLYRPGKAVVVGDRIDTDVEFARLWGVDSLLVLTGMYRIVGVEEAARMAGEGVKVARSLGEFCRGG
ncbi:HAD-IIA family hydrolase [Aeropyrum camini]|uniref:Phosphatase n=1 Tax=Aeropyrum camini SY1 = JCM 12091 TaxID=1198449 RepID=U3TDG9_9CREN|nr:HAD-IIA family hydrolase [Aeropyrum camini]BAN90476.1 phosphatase [Aeropyrum camini SY1 = JCM 12091]